MIAGIELGGTKTVVATGTADGTVQEEWRFPTTEPEETFRRACGWLAEARLGAAAGLEDVAYITIGGGIGAGILTGGELVHGALHPEFGHLKVPRPANDGFAGVCPFHADCLEGLASGPAIAARWGRPGVELPADHPAWEMEAWYLAHGVLALLAIVSPARVIIGGGVSQAEGFHARTGTLLEKLAAGYYPQLTGAPYLVPPLLGQQAGIMGALLLAGR